MLSLRLLCFPLGGQGFPATKKENIAKLEAEKELIKEFGADYTDYKKNVPMFFPKIKKGNK